MKSIFIIILVFIISVLSYGQQLHQAESFELSAPVTGSHIYEASQFIKMLPGFQYTPATSEEFVGRINPYLVFPPTQGIFGGPESGDNGVVGNFNGVCNVSQSGALTYSLQLDVIPGINNMQPDISLEYNSFFDDGYLGVGWAISGLSSISRVGSNIYNDGNISVQNFGNDDRFELDGNRLMAIDGGVYSAATTKYRTEIENFSIIISHKDDGNITPMPDWFEVKTKSGLTMYYGSSLEARIEPQGQSTVFYSSWLIDKIEDRQGNYILFFYNKNKESGEYYIDKIEYTGNDNTQPITTPFARIKFEYEDRDYPIIAFHNGSKSTISKTLNTIRVQYHDADYKVYNLIYSNEKIQPFLNKIVFGNSELINPLEFTYAPPPNNSISETASSTLSDQYNYLFGDYNGDGLTDVIGTSKPEYYYFHKKMFISLNNNGVIPQTPTCSVDLPLTFESTEGYFDYWHRYHAPKIVSSGTILNQQVFDFNGDGKCDILFIDKFEEGSTNLWNYFVYYYDEGTNELKKDNSFWTALPMEHQNFCVIPSDFDGDKLTDFLIFDTDNTTYPIRIKTHCTQAGCQLWNELGFSNICQWDINSKVDLGDFNGDGKVDWMVRNPNTCKIFTFNNGYIEPFYSSLNHPDDPFPNYLDELQCDDFNGDGITDILRIRRYDSDLEPYMYKYNYEICCFDGTRFVNGTSPLQSSYGFVRTLFTSDYNKDGMSDILEHSFSPSNTSKIYYSNGESFENVQDISFTDSFTDQYLGDFNGDGTCDFYLGNVNGNGKILTFNPIDKSRLLQTITDSYNSKVEVSYEFLTNNLTYHRTPINNYEETFEIPENHLLPTIQYIQFPLHVVSTIESEDGNGGTNLIQYLYSGARIHTEGRGFLGFRTNHSYNFKTKIYQDNLDGINYDLYVPLPEKNETGFILDNSSEKISEIFYGYTVHNQGDKRFFPYCSSSTNHSWTPDNVIIKTEQAITQYDETDVLYGNVTTEIKCSDESYLNENSLPSEFEFKTEVAYDYDSPDIENWVLDRLTSKTVTSKVPYPNSPEIVKTSNYFYYSPDNSSYPLLRKTVNFRDDYETWEEYNYDIVGNLIYIKQSAPNYIDPVTNSSISPHETFFEYNVQYDRRFLTKSITGALSKELVLYPQTGLTKESTDANGLKTYYYYDSFNRLYKTANPDGTISVSFLYWKTNQSGLPENTLFYNWSCNSGQTPIITLYDKYSREIGKITKAYDKSDVLNEVSYDNAGRLEYIYEPNDKTKYTKKFYNEFGQLSKILNPDQSSVLYSYSGRSTTVKYASQNPTTKITNSLGWVEESIDQQGKALKYEYFSDGQVRKIFIDGEPGSAIEYTYNSITGSPESVLDPDAGLIEYTYNPFGQIVKQKYTQNNNQTIEYTNKYDQYNRKIEQYNLNEGITSWEYDTKPYGKGLISKIQNLTTGHIVENSYDQLSRTKVVNETIDGVVYESSVEYDPLGRVFKTVYPHSNETPALITRNKYGDNGELISIFDDIDNSLIWNLGGKNLNNQITDYTLGNNFETHQDYYPLTHMPHTKQTYKNSEFIQDLEYGWDELSNLRYRVKWLNQNHTLFLKEEFSYDELNRLDITKLNEVQTSDVDYLLNGNIQAKTGLGEYTYGEDGAGIHAVSSIENTSGLINNTQQNITYTPFNKVNHISQSIDKTLDIQYGVDQQRIKQTQVIDGSSSTKIFIGNVAEKVENINGIVNYYYISSPTGLCAIFVKPESEDGYFRYIHTDHLGSVQCITDETGNLITEYSFDAWGNQRDANTWQTTNSPLPELFCNRGFTGHEQLLPFGLINMNGRMYDPTVGRMLSPDNYIQSPDYTQSLNRYSYCFNNPLKYTDPSGEITGFIPGFIYYGLKGALIDGLVSTGIAYLNHGNLTDAFWQGFTGGIINNGLSGGMMLGMQAVNDHRNFFTGLYGVEFRPKNLQEKINIMVIALHNKLDEVAGKTGRYDRVFVATNRNINSLDDNTYNYSSTLFGDIQMTYNIHNDPNDPNNITTVNTIINGITVRDKMAFEGERFYSTIYLSKHTVRAMWAVYNQTSLDYFANAFHTIYHEWAHANDYYSGYYAKTWYQETGNGAYSISINPLLEMRTYERINLRYFPFDQGMYNTYIRNVNDWTIMRISRMIDIEIMEPLFSE